jgi:hypothetical protein
MVSDQVCIVVCDNVGLCDTARVTINVTPVNDKPLAVDDYFVNCVGASISDNVLSNDIDADGPFLTVFR